MRIGWNTFLIVVIAAGVLSILGVVTSLTARNHVTQPIAFNHKKHVVDLSLPCAGCHQSAGAETFAGLPQVETCIMCHAVPLTQNPEEEKIRTYAANGQKIPWVRLYQQPGDVFFSHRRHVAVAEVGCATCHGNMAEQVTPPPRPLVNQTMAWCIECHQQRRASVDCNACHR